MGSRCSGRTVHSSLARQAAARPGGKREGDLRIDLDDRQGGIAPEVVERKLMSSTPSWSSSGRCHARSSVESDLRVLAQHVGEPEELLVRDFGLRHEELWRPAPVLRVPHRHELDPGALFVLRADRVVRDRAVRTRGPRRRTRRRSVAGRRSRIGHTDSLRVTSNDLGSSFPRAIARGDADHVAPGGQRPGGQDPVCSSIPRGATDAVMARAARPEISTVDEVRAEVRARCPMISSRSSSKSLSGPGLSSRSGDPDAQIDRRRRRVDEHADLVEGLGLDALRALRVELDPVRLGARRRPASRSSSWRPACGPSAAR